MPTQAKERLRSGSQHKRKVWRTHVLVSRKQSGIHLEVLTHASNSKEYAYVWNMEYCKGCARRHQLKDDKLLGKHTCCMNVCAQNAHTSYVKVGSRPQALARPQKHAPALFVRKCSPLTCTCYFPSLRSSLF